MLKSWLISPFQSEIEATMRQPHTAYTDRTTDRASSGRSCHWPVNAIVTHQTPSSSAAQSAKSPRTVMDPHEALRGLPRKLAGLEEKEIRTSWGSVASPAGAGYHLGPEFPN